jgi:hypothetical protein
MIRGAGVLEWLWSDAHRHRVGRLDLDAARREVVRLALAKVGIESLDLASKDCRPNEAFAPIGL